MQTRLGVDLGDLRRHAGQVRVGDNVVFEFQHLPAPLFADLHVANQRLAEDQRLPAIDIGAADLKPPFPHQLQKRAAQFRVALQEVFGKDYRIDQKGLIACRHTPLHILAEDLGAAFQAGLVVAQPEEIKMRTGEIGKRGS